MKEKKRLHIRNRNRDRYDLNALVVVTPELEQHIKPNKHGEASVDFSDPIAVKLLNKALLHHYYGIKHWEFPDKNLCPPIPGRADYLHYMADLLAENNFGHIPKGDMITCFDIGVGANCIYPIIGVVEYGWHFIGSDIDPKSIESANHIINANPQLKGKVEIKLQENRKDVFYGIINREDQIDLAICNPPFHSSSENALKGTQRKVRNLHGVKEAAPKLNFEGIQDELICEGGEAKFIQNMVRESKNYANNCYMFSTLVSKKSNLKWIKKSLEKLMASQIKVIPMGTGNKSSRVVAWSFLTKDERKIWRESRWNKKKS